MNSYLDRKAKDKSSNKHGRVSEKKAMKKLGAFQVPGSGSIDGFKSDGVSDKYRYENKSTINKSWGVKKEILDKIANEARGFGQLPIVSLSFVSGSGESIHNGDFVIMRRVDFQELNESAYGENY